MASAFQLFFKSNDTGSNVGKSPYITSGSSGVVLTNLVIREGRNDSHIYFALRANAAGLVQGNFNQLSDAASGNCVGYIQAPNFTFIPREGFAYFENASNDIVVHLVGERPKFI